MKETTHNLVPASADTLHAELRALIASSRQRLAGAVNAELTQLYWNVGHRPRTEVLGDGRASYGAQLLDQLGQKLAQEFGRGFESRNLRRMVRFAESFPDAAIVSTLSTQLSWSHMVAIVVLKTPQARQFYASQAATNTWSVRELHHQIERKAFERTELAALQTNTSVQAEPVVAANTAPALVFKDPYFLDFLGLRQGHDEADLEAAILRQLEAFILELGRAKRPPSASSCAPNPAANRWSCCKCTKTASPWPSTGPNCHPKRIWSISCMPLCLKRMSGWRGAGCCWGTWMMRDDMKVSKGLEFPVVALAGVGYMPAKGEDEQEAARVFYVAAYSTETRHRFQLKPRQSFQWKPSQCSGSNPTSNRDWTAPLVVG